jgi:hypothetical protein
MANQMDLLAHASQIDAANPKIPMGGAPKPATRAAPAPGGNIKPGQGIRQMPAGTTPSTPINRAEANKNILEQTTNQEHPFGKNDNNRAVAERVARDERRLGNKQTQQAVPLTPGEASERDLKAADAFENDNLDSLLHNTVADAHIAEQQRQEILGDRAEQVTALRASKPAPAPFAAQQPVQTATAPAGGATTPPAAGPPPPAPAGAGTSQGPNTQAPPAFAPPQ